MSFVMLDIVDRFSMISYKNSSFVIIQDGTSHYMKGIVLFLCYIVIGACFFVHKIPVSKCLAKKLFILTTHVAKQYNIYVIVFNSLFNNVYNFHDRWNNSQLRSWTILWSFERLSWLHCLGFTSQTKDWCIRKSISYFIHPFVKCWKNSFPFQLWPIERSSAGGYELRASLRKWGLHKLGERMNFRVEDDCI